MASSESSLGGELAHSLFGTALEDQSDESELSADEDVIDISSIGIPSRDDPEQEEARRRAHDEQMQKLTALRTAERCEYETTPASKIKFETQRLVDKAREYQQELFERAKDENIIAVLDTGMGKTLIAALLVRHVLEQQITETDAGKPRKHVVFLANSVPLVHQQARFLARNLPDPVQALTGQDNIDMWNREEWLQVLEKQSVIVCTPAILDQALFRNFIRMESLALVIFDEAHHCKRNHPYSRIIRDHFLKMNAQLQRPRLFSMTASPVDSKREISATIAELEELLHSKLVTVPDASLMDFAYKPVDQIWEYGHQGHVIPTDLYLSLASLGQVLPEIRSDLDAALQISSHLGTWFTDRLLWHRFGTDNAVRLLYGKFERSEKYTHMMDSEREAVRERFFAAPGLVQQKSVIVLRLALPVMSPKVMMLYDKLDALFTENKSARAMVFVEQRWTAVLLADAFKALGTHHLHAGYFTGSGTSGSEVVSALRQEQTMTRFNAGVLNILFTTSVGEEGIDIPLCNAVVRFDPNRKTIQYIQSRGRARMKDSIYAHMIEEHNFNQRANMEHFIESAAYLKAFCQQLPPDRLLGRGTKLAQILAKESSYRSFRTSNGAVCNFNNCLLVLSRYAKSLCHVGATMSEVYEEVIEESLGKENMYQYTVRLPVVGESIIKGAHGERRPNKILAKRSAAFNCVFKLRAAQLLDENLDSKFKRVRRVEHRMAVNDKKDPYEMVSKPGIWERGLGDTPSTLNAAVIEMQSHGHLHHALAPMVLLTRERLPEFPAFPIYLESGVPTDVVVTNIAQALEVDDICLHTLTCYTMHAIFEDVFNKVYKNDATRLGYWLAPRRAQSTVASSLESLVDITQMQTALTSRETWTPGTNPSKWCHRFLVDPLSGKHHYFTEDIVAGMSIFDAEPKEFLPSEGKKRLSASVINFTDSHWNLKQKEALAPIWDRDQPVISAELLTVRRNFLDKPTEQELKRPKCWIAPQPLELARLSVDAARTALAWPSILHRLESYLIVLEGFDTIGLRGIPSVLALEACTKDANSDDQEARTHSTRARGMGKNYERLEFIGDSLLKMTSTISVYNRTTGKEGDMHDRRKNILCNANMHNVSTQKLHFYRYIRTTGFDRATWYPEHLVLLKGRGANGQPVKHEKKTHDLGKKTIADVSESTIGACIMATKHLPLESRFNLGIRAITTLTDSDDHRISEWRDFAMQHSYQDWQLQTSDPLANEIAGQVASKIGYKFRYPRLARSAFTHPSHMHEPVPDYQRLEFLGDACFDWVAIWWLFDNNPDGSPEWLTEHKMAMVSNQFLAALAVMLGFDRLFRVYNIKLMNAVFEYAEEMRQLRQEYPDAPDFWRKGQKPVPKALADQVEATIGAMLVDSKFDFAPIEKFFFDHVEPYFRDIALYDGFANRHPTSLLHKTIQGDYACSGSRIDIRHPSGLVIDEDGLDELPEDQKITASVFVHNQCIGFAEGTSSRYAKVKASAKALRVLDGMSRAEFREMYGCSCGANGRDVDVEVEDVQ
ncbi:uncharacterized protein HMPREF1541_03863 [Cyphellophora europaea CBS 101466]|uniref:Dicer-like protein 1 n=1 Tax=Cyphellophora europaea (strain CBS 101466) TaxID=1220924 RepID=W2S1V3_CYPE1|nr:uncharacterized protein HMPREF1541_03863 [Cyphellophora europaea CBS 101466]ETN41924.1 hypothetical protein HMPREF1541_03863 [Cyphellophora europaea CBS 101466]